MSYVALGAGPFPAGANIPAHGLDIGCRPSSEARWIELPRDQVKQTLPNRVSLRSSSPCVPWIGRNSSRPVKRKRNSHRLRPEKPAPQFVNVGLSPVQLQARALSGACNWA